MRFLLVASLVACGGAPPPQPKNTADETPSVVAPPPEPAEAPVARSDRQAVELAIEVLGQMAEAAANRGGRCDEMGAELFGLADANRDVFAQLGEIARDEQRAPALEAQRVRLDQALAVFAERLGPCGADPSLHAALEGLSPQL